MAGFKHRSKLSVQIQDSDRRDLLQMSDSQLEDVAKVCNRYPDIQVNYELVGGSTVGAEENVSMQIVLEREETAEIRPVDAPR